MLLDLAGDLVVTLLSFSSAWLLLVGGKFRQRFTRLIFNKTVEGILGNLISKFSWKILDVDSILSEITSQNERLLKLQLAVLFVDAFVFLILACQQSVESGDLFKKIIEQMNNIKDQKKCRRNQSNSITKASQGIKSGTYLFLKWSVFATQSVNNAFEALKLVLFFNSALQSTLSVLQQSSLSFRKIPARNLLFNFGELSRDGSFR